MSTEIRLKNSPFAFPRSPAAQAPLPRDLAEQVKFFAGDPAEGVLWSDVLAHLRGGLTHLQRLLTHRGAPGAH
jgi:hypothetical protein